MKSLQQLSFIGMGLALILTSCTMEKRVYMSGYHMKWNESEHNHDGQQLASKDNVRGTEQNQTVTIEQPGTATNTGDNAFAPTATDDHTTASIDNQQIILPQEEKINLLSSHKMKVAENETKPPFKSEFREGAKMILDNGDEPKMNGMAIAGFICSLAGLFIFGFILGVLAIIFSGIGLGKIKKDSSKWKGKGLAIAGLILGIIDIVAWLIILALIL